MRKILLYLFFSPFLVWCQKTPEFKAKFLFTDKLGNKDTIVVGHDKTASININPQFGEVDISGKPFNKILDVRITSNNDYETKSKILDFTKCSKNGKLEFWILIRASNLPVTMTWDNTLFQDSCYKSSLFTRTSTTVLYGGNSVSDPTLRFLKDKGSLVIDQKYINVFNKYYNYSIEKMDDNTQDTVQRFFMAIGKNQASVGVNDNVFNEKIEIIPNPVTSDLSLRFNENVVLPNNVTMYILNLDGKVAQQQAISDGSTRIEADVSVLPKGLYFVQLRSGTEMLYTSKFVKIE